MAAKILFAVANVATFMVQGSAKRLQRTAGHERSDWRSKQLQKK
jgi:hypothetical protein